MNILATQYTLLTKSLEIYLAGCNGNPHCKGCHNPSTWDFDQGIKFDEIYFNESIKRKVLEFGSLIKNIMIFGGEPLDNDFEEVSEMLVMLGDFQIPIWLFTRYELDEIPDSIKNRCDYIKCGRYIEELKTDDNNQYGIKLATSNQKIYKKGVDY